MEPEQKKISCTLPSLSGRYQWFIAQNLDSHKHIFYTNPPQLHYQSQINELYGRRIRASFHGWVILSNHPDTVLWSLWNPLTSKLIRLPPLNHEQKHSHECCLSAPPDAAQTSLLLLTSPKVSTIVFCRLDSRNRKWIEMSCAKQLRTISGSVDDDCFLGSPTCCNGKVYALALGPGGYSIIEIDIVIKGKQVVITLLPFVEVPYTTPNRCPASNSFHYGHDFLKGSSSQLFYIGVALKDETDKTIGDVYLFTLDMTSMVWEEMVDFKDATFFIEIATEYSTCYYSSSATVDSELKGCVHILDESGKIIYSFHAKDRTLSISSMPCIVLESQASAWAMLEWRLENDYVESKQEDDKDTQIVVRPVKGDHTDFNSTTSESRLLNIPIHILEVVMELCIGIEYMSFRATCKHCYLAAPMIKWSNKTTLRRLQTYSLDSPWLMVSDHYRGIITFVDPIHGERYFIETPQELKGDFQIYCSRYGWLLMYRIWSIRCEQELAFFNPFTGSIRKLPPAAPYLGSYCFSAPPTSPDCMVVGFTTCEDVYYHFVSRDSIWHHFLLNVGDNDPYSFIFSTFNGRDVYVLCDNKGIEVFRDMIEDDYSWEVVVDKASISGCRSPAQYFLSICDQHLLLVIVGEFGESVEVFKANEATEEWEKLDGLGKHMVYISGTSCICLEAKLPEMENKIYFPRLLHNEDEKIVFYSLETRRFHTFKEKVIQERYSADLLGTKHYCYPHAWIEPNWS